MAAEELRPRPAGSRWTDDQWAGIVMPGSVLVSAGAGSGKTAVLSERCADLICVAPPEQRCDVDQLLVVTFTEDVAAEMNSRIARALRDRIERSPGDKRLARQLRLIDRAQIGTLHGFCSHLIRQHFHRLDLDPDFKTLDSDEATLLRNEVARRLFEQRYESDDPAFRALIDAYAGGYDRHLIARIVKTHELLTSVVDPDGWIESALRRIAEPTIGTFDQSALGRELHGEIDAGFKSLRQACISSADAIEQIGGFEAYLGAIRQCEKIVEHWQNILETQGIDALSVAAENVTFEKLKSLPNSMPGKVPAKSIVDALRDEMKEGRLRQTLAFTKAQWCDGLTRILPHARAFLDLVRDFGRRYADEKALLHAVDFADLERFALKLLTGGITNGGGSHAPRLVPSAVAARLHRQFAYVLVDEYQDINEVQEAILCLTSHECLQEEGEYTGSDDPARRPNLFCVGDVKQSIYRFRLAEPALFLRRAERYGSSSDREAESAAGSGRAPGTLIHLQQNFRSREPLLQALNGLFGLLMSKDAADIEYDDSQKLIAGATDFPAGAGYFSGAPIELHLLPAARDRGGAVHGDSDDGDEEAPDQTEAEARFVASRLRGLIGEGAASPVKVWDKDQKESRDLAWGDIVILLRSMKHKADDFVDVLRAAGIPVHADSSTGYFESMEVRDMRALLSVLDNRAQDIPLAAVLRSPIANLAHPEDALSAIRLAYGRSLAFPQAATRYASEKRDALADELRRVFSRLDRWSAMARQRPLDELIWDVYDSAGYLAFCAGLENGRQREANLLDLHQRARQFRGFQRQGLPRFLAFLEQLEEESDLGQPSVVSAGENVVRIMSIHRSKGLEFPVVVLPDLGKKINTMDCAGSILADRQARLGMDVIDEALLVRYPSLASTLVGRRIRRQLMAEELRTLYVATTRAREHLILVGTCKEEAVGNWRARWGAHRGRLPVDVVQGAGRMLDWIGPAAAALSASGDSAIQIIPHHDEPIDAVETEKSDHSSNNEDPAARLADLKPLSPAPARDPTADAIINRLTFAYPFERFTRLPAVETATSLGKSDVASSRVTGAPRPAPATTHAHTDDAQSELALPRAVQPSVKPRAADVGEATHLVLQYLDFAQPCDDSNLKSQLADFTDRRLVSPASAELVDLDALRWLAAGKIGQLLRENASGVRRELSLYLALDPDELDPDATSTDPRDRVMVRSRIDVLVQTPRGHEIIDYKTDRVSQGELAARAEIYRPQMALYRRGIERITGSALAAVHLVFLHPREIVTL